MVMYVDGYGLTQDRVYASWFMVLLGILFVIVTIKQFKENLKISKCFTGAFLVMFAILCFSRPDAVIAKYNIEMYRADYLLELDTDALLRLSKGASLNIIELLHISHLLDLTDKIIAYRNQKNSGR